MKPFFSGIDFGLKGINWSGVILDKFVYFFHVDLIIDWDIESIKLEYFLFL